MSPLKGKTVLVTGASSGIGLSLCKFLLDRGANVLGVTRRPSALPGGVTPIQADLTKREEISAIFQGLGKIDALVNSAGIAYLSRIADGNPADWEEMWRVNVMALALCCQLSLKHFPSNGGRIVNVSSLSGHRVPPTGGFYAPTKFAVKGITQALRSELKAIHSPVQVAAVSPGFVDTPLLEQYFRGREDVLSQTRENVRMLDSEDVAWAILSILEAPAHVEIADILLRGSGQHM
ncbi:SDR family NAD(P)-dependent oxidoreductase [Luteolibacter pohnpeiensis]|uniref:SDR family NAD(P)-dependent oxidoreductase n=1 Tax=Luteolibacter pohnpeiensis TaxID=454153 RepID=A0A934S6X1_9BACT|nr:SDR family NAD(P)-dependent oxidoreductase [Luteolibacter pohnpeiensis]MBK1882958.1 SDR family NAD(P)-dependent oxidoreductase [Luteolibacter pohnpeiensis]